MSIHQLERGSPSYPTLLERSPTPPAWLRVRGVLPCFDASVAIVGTRGASDRAIGFARALAATLASHGVVIVSGGAVGIDAAAHEGTLDVGGVTVIVHGSGLSHCYPAEHRELFARIRARGAEVSAFPDATPPLRTCLLARNRLIASLVQAVIVVEAPLRSGALSTAAAARKLRVPVLTVPGPVDEAVCAGSNALLRAGALPCLDASDVTVALGLGATCPHREPPCEVPPVSDDPILRALARGCRDLDALAESTGMPAPQLLARLTELELEGLVRSDPSGGFARFAPRRR